MFNSETTPVAADYFLKPGYIFTPERPTMISAVLGSCVSVCLYDRRRGAGGMNHFLLPFVGEKERFTARYGHVATVALIRMMSRQGSKIRHLEAQIFGGAHNPDVSPRNVGGENIRVAKKTLLGAGIHIVSEDTGGEKGRKVVFDTATGATASFKVEKLRIGDWYPYNHKG
jgi:chemotaxis protein CheD